MSKKSCNFESILYDKNAKTNNFIVYRRQILWIRISFLAVSTSGEVDFVCTNSSKERIYIQVAYLLAHEDTIEREYGALRAIKDNYPKYIISMTPLVKRNNDEGIIHLGLREFLINGL